MFAYERDPRGGVTRADRFFGEKRGNETELEPDVIGGPVLHPIETKAGGSVRDQHRSAPRPHHLTLAPPAVLVRRHGEWSTRTAIRVGHHETCMVEPEFDCGLRTERGAHPFECITKRPSELHARELAVLARPKLGAQPVRGPGKSQPPEQVARATYANEFRHDMFVCGAKRIDGLVNAGLAISLAPTGALVVVLAAP